MPSFLTKVFARKKPDARETTGNPRRSSDHSLLEGKFEAISPTVSPTATRFIEATEKGKEKERDLPFALFRPKSRAQSPPPRTTNRSSDIPHLTLNLPVPKEEKSRALGATFEADATGQSLPDHVINERTLNPLETLVLVGTCSKAITERGGLEALGVMHPHWHAASPDIQRKLISLYILSLAPKSPITTLSPTSDSSAAAFDSELRYARSPHDIAAVLRWGLRHLKLEGDSFGESSSSDQWHWYNSFYEAERTASYPPKFFSINLIPRLPPAHANILISTLDIISSLAAHAEVNGFSGSKLSKFCGLWLLSVQRSAETDDWNSFYSRWESAGRIMEHLFLSWLRDEATKHQMPKRLLELVDHYPFSSSASTNDGFLPRSRFSTRQYDTLFVRVETVVPDSVKIKSRQHPVRLINDALKSETTPGLGEHLASWEELKKLAAGGSDTNDNSWAPVLSRIFSDDTIGLLALIPADTEANLSFALQLPSRAVAANRRRSMSLGSVPGGRPAAKNPIDGNIPSSAVNGLHKPLAASLEASPESPKNWDEFSTAGFSELNISRDFASTLLDKDIEVTNPPLVRKPSKKRRRTSPLRRHTQSSLDVSSPASPSIPPQSETASSTAVITRSTSITLIQLDEAFVDFWSDALLDPVSYSWPKFVICQLRRPLEVAGGKKAVNWVVIEQIFTRPSPAPELRILPVSLENVEKSTGAPLKRTISPRTLAASSFSAAVRRFSLFGGNQDGKDVIKRKSSDGPKIPKIGELGEILLEEPEEREVGSKDKDGAFGAVASSTTVGALPTRVAVAQELKHKQPNGVNNVEVPQVKPVALPDVLPMQKDEALDRSVNNVPSPVDLTTSPPGDELVVKTTSFTTPADNTKEGPFVSKLSIVPLVGIAQKGATSMELQETGAPPDATSETTVKVSPMEIHPAQPDCVVSLAPDAVVQSGGTPGPQQALDSTAWPESGTAETPKSLPQPTDVPREVEDVPVDEDADFDLLSSPPVAIEPLPRGIGVENSEGFDLDEVPIVSTGETSLSPEVVNEPGASNAAEKSSSAPITKDDESHITMVVAPIPSSQPGESDDLQIVEEPSVQTTPAVYDSSKQLEYANEVTVTTLAPEQERKQEAEVDSTGSVMDAVPPVPETEIAEGAPAAVPNILQASEPANDLTATASVLEQDQEVDVDSMPVVEDAALETEPSVAETEIVEEPVVETTATVPDASQVAEDPIPPVLEEGTISEVTSYVAEDDPELSLRSEEPSDPDEVTPQSE